MTRKTHDAAERWCKLGALRDVRYFQAGDVLEFNGARLHTIPTAHDAVDGVSFVVECEQKRLGILTDLGHPFEGLQDVLESVDAAYLESNYDPGMLRTGGYPLALQARISGDGGHLSNGEAAELLRGCGSNRPGWIALAHLSEHNNCPELAMKAQHDAVGQEYPVHIAHRDKVSSVLTV
jgi:phosphoribosyl 1,2-cyclic phosphodiesterase